MLVPPEGCEGKFVDASLLAFSGLLAVFDLPCLVDISPQSVPSFSDGFLLVYLSASKYSLFIPSLQKVRF